MFNNLISEVVMPILMSSATNQDLSQTLRCSIFKRLLHFTCPHFIMHTCMVVNWRQSECASTKQFRGFCLGFYDSIHLHLCRFVLHCMVMKMLSSWYISTCFFLSHHFVEVWQFLNSLQNGGTMQLGLFEFFQPPKPFTRLQYIFHLMAMHI